MSSSNGTSSIYSVAKAAGTSVGTVSNVINHPERVSDELRTRVEAVMAEQKFHPHPVARALSMGGTKMIGTIVFDIANPFFAEFAHRIDRSLQGTDYSLVISGTEQSQDSEQDALRNMSNAGAVAFAVCSAGGNFENLARLQSRGIPVMLYAQRSEDPRFESVTLDDRRGMALIATHLLDKGVEKFCYIQEPIHAMQHRDRWEGFSKTLEERGFDVGKVRLEVSSGPTWDGGSKVVKRILENNPSNPPECFVCLNDYTAMGVSSALRQAGLKVGRDILVTGYDDIPYASALEVPLTTVRQPMEKMSWHLVSQLTSAIEKHEVEVEGKIFEPELVLRESA